MRSSFCVLSGFVLLAACGGGGGGTGVAPIGGTPPPVAPAPTPAPAPAPTPTPTYELAGDRSRDRSLEGVGAGIKGFIYNGNSEPGLNLTSELNQQFSNRGLIVTYDAAARTYTVQLNGEREVFGPSDVLSDDERGVASQKGRSLFGIVRPAPEYRYLNLVRWDTGSPETRTARGFGSTSVSRYAIVGSPTVFSDIPKSGSATYRASFIGTGYGPGTHLGSYQGNAFLTADFGAGRLSMEMPLTLTDPFTMRLSATIASGANAVTGTVTSPDSAYRGDFSGAFYGPAGIELGGIIQLTKGADAGISGALTAWRQSPP